jgi:hypothetical protein|tara:strand:- start:58 stop:396 length:339 start_codon:yes stop_codon:yes gene_type:complete
LSSPSNDFQFITYHQQPKSALKASSSTRPKTRNSKERISEQEQALLALPSSPDELKEYMDCPLVWQAHSSSAQDISSIIEIITSNNIVIRFIFIHLSIGLVIIGNTFHWLTD